MSKPSWRGDNNRILERKFWEKRFFGLFLVGLFVLFMQWDEFNIMMNHVTFHLNYSHDKSSLSAVKEFYQQYNSTLNYYNENSSTSTIPFHVDIERSADRMDKNDFLDVTYTTNDTIHQNKTSEILHSVSLMDETSVFINLTNDTNSSIVSRPSIQNINNQNYNNTSVDETTLRSENDSLSSTTSSELINSSQIKTKTEVSFVSSPNSKTTEQSPSLTVPRYSFTNETLASHYYCAYKFKRVGLGSALMHMFTKMIYMQEVYNRTFMVIESDFAYRRNESHGVLSGFFSPKFPVVDRIDQHELVEQYTDGVKLSEFHTSIKDYSGRNNKNSTRIWVVGIEEFRWAVAYKYRKQYKPNQFLQHILPFACPHLERNEETKQEMNALLQEYGIPNLLQRESNITSVAFHVRRTDKIIGESRKYEAYEYVGKLVTILPSNQTIHHCYVATDDVVALEEMKVALENASITCQVHSLIQGTLSLNRRETTSETLKLITDLSVLASTTYFVGTFNSNIGGLTGILRGCEQPGVPHNSHSYGVDQENWDIRWF